MLAEHDEGGVAIASEAGESHRDGAGECRRTVEHDERKGAASQQDIGAPNGSRRIGRPDHPHAFDIAQMHPVPWVEGALGVDVGHPAMLRHGGFDDRAGERGLPTSHSPDDLGKPAARQSASAERGVERRDSGGEGGCGGGRRGGKEPNELGQGDRHELEVSRYDAVAE